MLEKQGFELIQGLLYNHLRDTLITEFDRLSELTGNICVRQVFTLSDIIRSFAISPELLRYLPDNFTPVRCILFNKTAKHNWPVAWHQDLTIAVKEKVAVEGYLNWSQKDNVPHVQPPVHLMEKMITARIHLDETSAENGALKVIPGSHQLGRIQSSEITAKTATKSTICTCARGDLLLIKPLILHASAKSTTPAQRRVIHIEYADRSTLNPSLQWYDDL